MAERLVKEKTINIFKTAECRWWVFHRKWIKESPNSNLDNFIIGLSHQSCAFWRMGLDSYFCFVQITKSEFATRGREKIAYWCTPSLLYSLFLPLLRSFSFLSISCFSCYPPSIYCYYSYLFWVNPMWFLTFAFVAYQPFFSTVNTFSELPTTLLAIRPLLHLGMPDVLSLPLPIPWQILICLILQWVFLSFSDE